MIQANLLLPKDLTIAMLAAMMLAHVAAEKSSRNVTTKAKFTTMKNPSKILQLLLLSFLLISTGCNNSNPAMKKIDPTTLKPAQADVQLDQILLTSVNSTNTQFFKEHIGIRRLFGKN
jgi:hypothetical protein